LSDPSVMRLYIIFSLLCVSAAFWGCDGNAKDVRSYYFPVEALKKGKVYAYQVRQGDSEALEYWYYRGFMRDTGTFLVATYYDQNFQIGQIRREKISEKGAFARTYMFYEPDSTGQDEGGQIQSSALIESPQVFSFKTGRRDESPAFRIFYHPPGDTETRVYVSRTRRFMGDAPAFEFKGKKLDCIRFALDETISYDERGTNDVTVSGEEWYAKGLGLVWYRKTFGSGAFSVEGRLSELISMAELERRAAAHYGE
jgi:hypothetical protein